MLIDEVTITVKAGDGGKGKIHFAPRMGGPDGGNGGKGADVYLEATSDLTALNQFAGKIEIAAQSGGHGGNQKKTGRGGEDLTLRMPIGTAVVDTRSGERFIISNDSDRIKIATGGYGGRGNYELRSATLRTPRIAEPGQPGQARELFCDLEFFAQIGLIGLPNSGKSSLLNALTRANAKIGDYPFTTLEPNLGVCDGVIIADIPGIIEGASSGRGLGIKFLKHISKVSMLFHCISCDSEEPLADYQVIRQELAAYNKEMLHKSELIFLTKADLITPVEIRKRQKMLKIYGHEVIPVSIIDQRNIALLKKKIFQLS